MGFLGKNVTFHDPSAGPVVNGEVTTVVTRPGERW